MSKRRAYSPEEVADMLPVDAVSVRRKCAAGQIRAAKWGNRWIIPAEEVDRLRGMGAPESGEGDGEKPPGRAKKLRLTAPSVV